MKYLLLIVFSTLLFSLPSTAQVDNHDVPIIATTGPTDADASVPLGMERTPALLTEIQDFEAYDRPTGIQIEWKSLEEYYNGGFEVLRSRDGEVWTALEFIPGQNVSHRTYAQYEYFDSYPHEGDNYYMLRKIYVDGSSAYSLPVRVWYRSTAGSYGFTIYPNPASQSQAVFVKLEEAPPSGTLMALYDMNGHLLDQYNVSDFRENINLGALTPGNYVVSARIGEQVFSKRLIVH